jgi:hypothetical protein
MGLGGGVRSLLLSYGWRKHTSVSTGPRAASLALASRSLRAAACSCFCPCATSPAWSAKSFLTSQKTAARELHRLEPFTASHSALALSLSNSPL